MTSVVDFGYDSDGASICVNARSRLLVRTSHSSDIVGTHWQCDGCRRLYPRRTNQVQRLSPMFLHNLCPHCAERPLSEYESEAILSAPRFLYFIVKDPQTIYRYQGFKCPGVASYYLVSSSLTVVS